MNKFQPYINVAYPSGNKPIFEEWFSENYKGCNTDRELLQVHFCSYYVNNDYGNDQQARKELQDFLNSLDRSKKYFSINQYDDAILDDVSHLDLLQFNMSKAYDVPLPLMCQPHPYEFSGGKKWFANFVGSRTHPIRDSADGLKHENGYYVSFDRMEIDAYCKILHESIFTLCYRGYGLNSFRIAEAVQYGSIPVYISNEHILPFGVDFEEFGVLMNEEDAGIIDEILTAIPPEEIIRKQNNLPIYYEKYFSYDGCMKQIIKYLETEYHSRQSE